MQEALHITLPSSPLTGVGIVVYIVTSHVIRRQELSLVLLLGVFHSHLFTFKVHGNSYRQDSSAAPGEGDAGSVG
jgi:hypothetical protein